MAMSGQTLPASLPTNVIPPRLRPTLAPIAPHTTGGVTPTRGGSTVVEKSAMGELEDIFKNAGPPVMSISPTPTQPVSSGTIDFAPVAASRPSVTAGASAMDPFGLPIPPMAAPIKPQQTGATTVSNASFEAVDPFGLDAFGAEPFPKQEQQKPTPQAMLPLPPSMAQSGSMPGDVSRRMTTMNMISSFSSAGLGSSPSLTDDRSAELANAKSQLRDVEMQWGAITPLTDDLRQKREANEAELKEVTSRKQELTLKLSQARATYETETVILAENEATLAREAAVLEQQRALQAQAEQILNEMKAEKDQKMRLIEENRRELEEVQALTNQFQEEIRKMSEEVEGVRAELKKQTALLQVNKQVLNAAQMEYQQVKMDLQREEQMLDYERKRNNETTTKIAVQTAMTEKEKSRSKSALDGLGGSSDALGSMGSIGMASTKSRPPAPPPPVSRQLNTSTPSTPHPPAQAVNSSSASTSSAHFDNLFGSMTSLDGSASPASSSSVMPKPSFSNLNDAFFTPNASPAPASATLAQEPVEALAPPAVPVVAGDVVENHADLQTLTKTPSNSGPPPPMPPLSTKPKKALSNSNLDEVFANPATPPSEPAVAAAAAAVAAPEITAPAIPDATPSPAPAAIPAHLHPAPYLRLDSFASAGGASSGDSSSVHSASGGPRRSVKAVDAEKAFRDAFVAEDATVPEEDVVVVDGASAPEDVHAFEAAVVGDPAAWDFDEQFHDAKENGFGAPAAAGGAAAFSASFDDAFGEAAGGSPPKATTVTDFDEAFGGGVAAAPVAATSFSFDEAFGGFGDGKPAASGDAGGAAAFDAVFGGPAVFEPAKDGGFGFEDADFGAVVVGKDVGGKTEDVAVKEDVMAGEVGQVEQVPPELVAEAEAGEDATPELKEMMRMGFSKKASISALEKHGFDVTKATDELVEGDGNP
ncbi:hypothetical protein HK101_010085 [Irineochytrium annulatum]|nr:hypothetical protein HK101_010085 [Irineochytrium annulatum]